MTVGEGSEGISRVSGLDGNGEANEIETVLVLRVEESKSLEDSRGGRIGTVSVLELLDLEKGDPQLERTTLPEQLPNQELPPLTVQLVFSLVHNLVVVKLLVFCRRVCERLKGRSDDGFDKFDLLVGSGVLELLSVQEAHGVERDLTRRDLKRRKVDRWGLERKRDGWMDSKDDGDFLNEGPQFPPFLSCESTMFGIEEGEVVRGSRDGN